MKEQIEHDLAANQVVLYMKGLPGDSPCGYSSRMVGMLDHIGVDYVTRDVLASNGLRTGIKTYSGVKTLPQLFINGKFAGGTDNIRELFETKRLQAFLGDHGIAIDPENLEIELLISDVSRDEKIACAAN